MDEFPGDRSSSGDNGGHGDAVYGVENNVGDDVAVVDPLNLGTIGCRVKLEDLVEENWQG